MFHEKHLRNFASCFWTKTFLKLGVYKMSEIRTTPFSAEETARMKQLYDPFVKYGQTYLRTIPGNYVFPAAYEKYKDRLKNWQIRESDIYVLAFPKNGTTWTQELVWCVQNNCDLDAAKATTLDNRVPFLEFPVVLEITKDKLPFTMEGYFENMIKMPQPRILKSHLPFSLLPDDILVKSKAVLCLRNPKDTVVSFYHHAKLVEQVGYTGDFPTYFELFMDGLTMWSSYFDFMTEMWQKRDHPNLCVLFFEEMKRDQAPSIRKVARFLDKNLTDVQIDALVSHLSFKNFQRNPAVNKEDLRDMAFRDKDGVFIRKGEIGDWKNYFNDDMNKRMDEAIEKYLKPIGLNFIYE